MKRADYARWKNHRKGKGFSLTELVIVIIIIAILALAVFAGGSSAIKKAKISRVTSSNTRVLVHGTSSCISS